MDTNSLATAEYFEEYFGSPPARIADRLDRELERASRALRADLRSCGVDLDALIAGRDVDPNLVSDIVCEMVRTAASSTGDVGVASVQQGAGPFQQTLTYTNPAGDLYIGTKHRRWLGVGGRVVSAPVGGMQAGRYRSTA